MSAKKKNQPAKAVPAAVPVTPKAPIAPKSQVKQDAPGLDIFSMLGSRAQWVMLGLLLITGFIVFKDYLLFDKGYFFKDIGSDSYNSSYPYLINAADYIAKHGMPKWSFDFGMGQSIFPFVFHDPFDIFLYLAGKDHIFFMMVYLELAKIVLSGFIFYKFLRAVRLSSYTAMVGGLVFAYCGLAVVGSCWFIFSFEIFNLALLLLALERLLQYNKWHLFPVAIFLVCISQPFNLYVYGLILLGYTILRLYQLDRLNAKGITTALGQMIGYGLLGMLISAPFFIENIVQILESPRGSGTNSYAHVLASKPMFDLADKMQLGTGIMRFFSSDMMGTGNDFKGWQNYLEAPLFYCGLPTLLLAPQIFPFLSSRKRTFFIVFLGIWIFPFLFPWFRYAFWMFTGDYYRAYSIAVGFVLIYYAVQALQMIIDQRKISLVILGITVAFLLLLLNYPFFPDKEMVNGTLSAFASVMLVVYAALLFFMSRPNASVYVKYAFLAVVVCEVAYLSNISVNERDPELASEVVQKSGYNDYTIEAVNYLKNTDHSFYRIDKSYASSPAMHYSLNDGMAQLYHGTSSYSSFNQEYYVFYLQLMGISDKNDELQSRWAMGLTNRPVLESENRVKYDLAKKNINPVWRLTCDSIASFGDVLVLRNKFILPVGYTFDTYIRQSVFAGLSNNQKDFVSLRACVLKDGDVGKYAGLKEFQLRDTVAPSAFTFDVYKSYESELVKDTLAVSRFEDNQIAGTIHASKDEMMYLSVPYDAGWKLKVDGEPYEKTILSAGMTGLWLKKGAHTIAMTYDLRYVGKGLVLTIIGLLAYAGLWWYGRRKKESEVTPRP